MQLESKSAEHISYNRINRNLSSILTGNNQNIILLKPSLQKLGVGTTYETSSDKRL